MEIVLVILLALSYLILRPGVGVSIAPKTSTAPNGADVKIGERSKRLFEKCL